MKKTRTFLAGLSALLLLGCGRQAQTPISQDELIIRTNAMVYRDAYVSGFSLAGSENVATNLARSTIQSVEQLPSGWHVVFSTKTSEHEYVLDVYLKDSGKLDKIVRQPTR
jgi:hypothetical protein